MDRTEVGLADQTDVVVTLKEILSTLKRMDERLLQINANTKASDEESTCIHRKTEETVLVCVRVNISSVSNIDTVAQEFTCEFFLAATWEEPQLLGKSSSASVDWTKNWDPRIYFANAVEIKSMHKKHRIIGIEGNPVPVVQISYRVVGRFKTLFSLHNFPFDYQTLKIEISSKWSSAVVVFDRTPNIPCVLSNENFLGKEQWDLLDHVITKDSTSSEDPSKVSMITYSSYAFEFHIKRKYTYFLTNIVCLMFLISLLSFTTFFVSPDSIGDRLGVILTLLLTAVTFKFVVSQSLPPVSYLTVLDWYVLSTVVFIFSVAIENSVVAKMERKSHQLMVDESAWSVSIVVFILIHVFFIVKAALIVRNVRKALAYHQRCYQWKNGVLPICDKLVPKASPKAPLSTLIPRLQPSVVTHASVPGDRICGRVVSDTSERNLLQKDQKRISRIEEIDASPEFANEPGLSKQKCVSSIRKNDFRKPVNCEANGDRCEGTFYPLSRSENVESQPMRSVTRELSRADIAHDETIKSDTAKLMSSIQDLPLASDLEEAQIESVHIISLPNRIEESLMRGKTTTTPSLSQLQEAPKSSLPSATGTDESRRLHKSGNFHKLPVSSSLLSSSTPDMNFKTLSPSQLTTIKEDEVVNIECGPIRLSSLATSRVDSVDETAKYSNKVVDEGDDSSSSDLSDSEVTAPIPKTESDINALLIGGRNNKMNLGRSLAGF